MLAIHRPWMLPSSRKSFWQPSLLQRLLYDFELIQTQNSISLFFFSFLNSCIFLNRYWGIQIVNSSSRLWSHFHSYPRLELLEMAQSWNGQVDVYWNCFHHVLATPLFHQPWYSWHCRHKISRIQMSIIGMFHTYLVFSLVIQ